MISRVLVTGASRGIGRAVAHALAARGALVAAVGRDAQALAETVKAHPDRILPIACDVADPAQRSGLVGRALSALGTLDGFVSAAGIVRYDAIPNLGDVALRAQLEVNFVAPVLLAQDVARVLLSQSKGGSIVTVSSTLAFRAAPSTLAYSASKAALDAATRVLALELAPHSIRANSVQLGVVDTEMVRVPRLANGEPTPVGGSLDARIAKELDSLRKLTPLGRLGDAADVARTIVQVLDAEWMTGSAIVLDGGISL